MTFILGAKCSDGIVLIGDRKLSTEGGSWSGYGDKIREDVAGVVWGAAGTVNYYNSFRSRIRTTLEDQSVPPSHFLEVIENVHAELMSRYQYYYLREFAILVASNLRLKPELYLVGGSGGHAIVKEYETIGSGTPYGSYFLQKLWNPELTMKQVAEIGYFIIKLIDLNRLDETVGVGSNLAQVFYVPQSPGVIRQAEQSELRVLSDKAEKIVRTLEPMLKKLWGESA